MDLDAADFAIFFRAVHGYSPFPWQQALVDHLAEHDDWPEVLDLPTGCGKTAALDAAVFHLALRFEAPACAALRMALVVDRRLVVDDAYGRAKKIGRVLEEPTQVAVEGRPVVAEVARRLQRLAGDGERPLMVRRLRGGAPLESDWTRTPMQPTILCSTVDQVGSRLLFRGYGVSHRMKPVHAGLLGKHILILLDEAHLSEPFRQTLRALREIGKADIRTVVLSATPGASPTPPFRLTKADYAHPELKSRLDASKPATLEVVRGDPVEAFVKAACKTVEQLKREGIAAPAIGVVVNRVGLAREIFEQLIESGQETGSSAVLMIGRSRGVGMDRLDKALDSIRTMNRSRKPITSAPAGSRSSDPQPSPVQEAPDGTNPGALFVVATQCLEVGVDVDLDGLVTQAASFDALRQRFGRLNRSGRPISAMGMVLALAQDIKKSTDDAVYSDRIAKTWTALLEIGRDKIVDFGLLALERRLWECDLDVANLAAPRSQAPVLLPAYIDLWSRTSPPPAADPEVGLFLHGVERLSADVSLVWRGDIEAGDLARNGPKHRPDFVGLLRLVPPRAAEMVQIPLWSAKGWLRRSPNHEELTDISDAIERDSVQGPNHDRGSGRRAFRWAGADDPRTGLVAPDDLRPGDILVVPCEYGGCDAYGWAPRSEKHVPDVADEAARPFRRRRHAVRIARDIVSNDEQWARISAILADEVADGHDLLKRLLDALPSELSSERTDGNDDDDTVWPRQVREPLEALNDARGGRIDRHLYSSGLPDRGVILEAPNGLVNDGLADSASSEAGPATEDDSLSHSSRRAVSIDAHTGHVVDRVRRFVGMLNLSAPLASDLQLAAFLHDIGKADRRFQTMLGGGDPWNRQDGPALAKSGRRWQKGAWERADLPRGWRHEARSVRMAKEHPRFVEAHDPSLVLWLIGTHHGFGRPFFNFADPNEDRVVNETALVGPNGNEKPSAGPGPQSLAFEFKGRDWAALREALHKRYGVWGLAHLEAVLRLADHRASESEQRDD